jgi:exodeoxyribonuclease VII small subunit
MPDESTSAPPAADPAADAAGADDPQLLQAVADLRASVAVAAGTSFHAAYSELADLVAELEADRASVDELAVKVARADALARYCQDRVNTTRMICNVLDASDRPA